MKKNLIFSIISLCLSLMLFVFISFAWLTTNSRVTSDVLVVVTGGSDYTYDLQYYSDSESEWVTVTIENPIRFDKFDPGDAMYLRFVIASTSVNDGSIQATYDTYSSSVTSDIDVDLDDMKIYYNGVAILDIEDNTDTETSTSYPYVVKMEGEVIYLITSAGKITVADDYKIEKAMNSYNLGSSKTNYTPSELPSLVSSTKYSLDDYIFGPTGTTVYSKTTTYCYFAIEYEDFESSSSSGEYSSNNFFIYQSFNVRTIKVYL